MFAVINIALVNLLLSSDNVLIIALLGKHLTRGKRFLVLLWSMLASVVLQLGILFIVAFLFKITFLQSLFGLVICYMAFHLLHKNEPNKTINEAEPQNLLPSVWKIVLGNLMMSFENETTLISLSNGDPWMAWFGMLLTAPIIFFGSHLISWLLSKYDIIIYIGATVLFKIGLDLIFKVSFLNQYTYIGSWLLEVLFIIYVIRIYVEKKKIGLFRTRNID